MTRAKNAVLNNKISSQFASRLGRLGSNQTIRAILILETKGIGRESTRRASRSSRQASIEAIRKSAEPALRVIDQVLERFGGKRLAESPDLLGCIPVETTAAGIEGLAVSEHVKVILEDQPISLSQAKARVAVHRATSG